MGKAQTPRVKCDPMKLGLQRQDAVTNGNSSCLSSTLSSDPCFYREKKSGALADNQLTVNGFLLTLSLGIWRKDMLASSVGGIKLGVLEYNFDNIKK